jgi:hypothetical protein
MTAKKKVLSILISLLVTLTFVPMTGQAAFGGTLTAKAKIGTPENVTTKGKKSKITIEWSEVKGAAGYKVYRASSADGKYKKVITTKSNSGVNKAVKKGKKYFYKVRAYKKSKGKKIYGEYSEPVEGMTKVKRPKNVKAVIAEDGTVTVTWSKVKGADGYQLQRALLDDGKYKSIGKTKDLSFTDVITEKGEYSYRVRAYSKVNGKKQKGDYSAGGRYDAVTQARSWVGAKESNGSHKKIIDVFNDYNPSCGKIGYSTPWCAAFVSAVAIKTNTTDIIPVHSYCPTMLARFKDKSFKKKYKPQGGDVVFYDWNRNKVPDHVGMIESVSGKNVTAIEGNYSDRVKRRTFKKGYSCLLAYGLPDYSTDALVSYTRSGSGDSGIVTGKDVMKACEEIEAAEPDTEACAANEIVEYIQEEEPAAGENAEESEYNAFLVYEICDEMDIDACVVTITDSDGTKRSYNEVMLDGELYILDATDGGTLEKFTPEEIN